MHKNQKANSTPLRDAYARFCDLLTMSEEYFAAGNYPASVALAQIAARYAFPGDVGLFGSPRLERLLLELGKQIRVVPVDGARRRGDRPRKVLHILSYGRAIGGDSRYAWRWMQQDCDSTHSVVITTQADVKGVYEIPQILREAAEKSGGFLRVLGAPTTKQFEQASELRMLCQSVDVVVLHLFPYDIVPVLALAAGCDSTKVVFVNHSDHTFWLGASVAHSVIHLRTQSADFLRNHRGLDPELSSFLPTPLFDFVPPVDRTQAKRALGYDPDVILLLTIASPFKYSSPGQIGFLELVAPVLVQLPQAVLLAVGPKPEGVWQSANIQTKGRIVPLGTRWENDLLYSAADVYLDSVPFSSITSVLEAGSRGVSLLGYNPANSELRLLGPSAPGLDNAMELAEDAESYRNLLTRLIKDPEFRCQSGQRVQSRILASHTGSNWISALNDIYATLEQVSERKCLIATEDTFESGALNLALVELYRQPQSQGRRLIGKYVGALPYCSRFLITWRLRSKGFGLCVLNLFPPPVEAIIRIFGRWAKRAIRPIVRVG